MTYSVKVYDKITHQLVEAEIRGRISREKRFYKIVEMTVEDDSVSNKENVIGRMIYFFGENELNIQMVWNDNQARYKKVGTGFVEYALHLSQKSRKNGGIVLQPAHKSEKFWRIFGFEYKKGSKENMHLTQKKVAEQLTRLTQAKDKEKQT